MTVNLDWLRKRLREAQSRFRAALLPIRDWYAVLCDDRPAMSAGRARWLRSSNNPGGFYQRAPRSCPERYDHPYSLRCRAVLERPCASRKTCAGPAGACRLSSRSHSH